MTWGSRTTSRRVTPLKHLSLFPRTGTTNIKKGVIIYRFQCPHINCPEEYIEESCRTLGDRLMEILKPQSPIHQHSQFTGHQMSPKCFSIINKRVIGVHHEHKGGHVHLVNDPSLNRNLGKYQLPHICDEVLKDTPSPQLN